MFIYDKPDGEGKNIVSKIAQLAEQFNVPLRKDFNSDFL